MTVAVVAELPMGGRRGDGRPEPTGRAPVDVA